EISIEQVFDLALRKTVLTAGPFTPGSNVTFRITLFNQGTLDATGIQVSDYIPAGLILSDAGWIAAGGVATLNTPVPFLAAGATTQVEITFTIDDNYLGTVIRNWAEISSASNVLNLPDVDSTPDGTNFNQPDETNDMDDDDVINEDGKNGGDEDDHDPAQISVVQIFDLALRKTVNTTATPGPYSPGDDVTFTIEVFNQGSVSATNI
ncbi:MAG: DUF11 domain-containing protein, partial [Lewinella sp.]|nr:DUF11 domain-containing protein [Lewinella sp.]